MYGAGRVVTDFARAADKNLVGTLTGSQVTALAAVAAVVAWIIATRPTKRTPWAWSPPTFAHGWGGAMTVPTGDESDLSESQPWP